MKLLSIIFLVASLHGFFLAVILLLKAKNKYSSNLYLAIILFIFSGYLLETYIRLENLIENIPHILAVFVPLFYLLGPLYYFYIRSMVVEDFQFNKKEFLHIIPAIIILITIIPFYTQSAEYKISLIHGIDTTNFKMPSNRAFYYGLNIIQISLYLIASKKKLRAIPLNIDGRSNQHYNTILQWLKIITLGFTIFLLCYVLVYLIFIFTDFLLFYLQLYFLLVPAVLIHLIGYITLKESVILTSKGISSQKKRNDETGLNSNRIKSLKSELLLLMEKEKVYLDPEITLNKISKRLSANSKYLSQLVNDEFQVNFSDFINSYRIKESLRIMSNKENDHLNLLGIAIEAGFTNKNTFNRAFKNFTGKTPSEYRKSTAD